MSFIVDSSVIVAWVYEDERTPPIELLLNTLVQQGAWVPAIWRLEVANALSQGVRRQRIGSDWRNRALGRLTLLPINVDSETDACAWNETLALADRFRLTLYDACYLELAQRRALPLATLDRDLRRSAETLGIELLGI